MSAQTITEKILAAHAGKSSVSPGDIVNCKVDFAFGNDITSPIALREFEKIGVPAVWSKEKFALIPDHFVPNKDIKSAQQAKEMREFARKHDLPNFFEVGCMGVEHALFPEQGFVYSGQVVVGADSHTCTYGALGAFSTGIGSTELAGVMATGELWFKVPESQLFSFSGKPSEFVCGKDYVLKVIGDIGVDGSLYKAMEFAGSGISALSMDSRMSICNMAIEAGGKSGIIAADEKTKQYVGAAKPRAGNPDYFYSDEDAEYPEKFEYDASEIEPMVAAPHLPSNARQAREFSNVEIDQVVIGSCTNGRMEDLLAAHAILKGKKANPRVRVLVIPATQKIYLEAVEAGLVADFVKAGAAVSTPTCGPCLGGYMGVLADGEKCIATTNRNFVGRMGSPKSEVFLASPSTAAASALTGKITDPRDV
ncbi:MAG: 3-isopropylmalate dehydratase large subunit [Candidatus Micrarchaeia archaeon]|jgi:3-isopropylmalate/(R)-2-methylmalate dehydratase large subunit